jgi:hypothetical protein
MKDAAISVNRCLWSPDGTILGMEWFTSVLPSTFVHAIMHHYGIFTGYFLLDPKWIYWVPPVSYKCDLISRCRFLKAYCSDVHIRT